MCFSATRTPAISTSTTMRTARQSRTPEPSPLFCLLGTVRRSEQRGRGTVKLGRQRISPPESRRVGPHRRAQLVHPPVGRREPWIPHHSSAIEEVTIPRERSVAADSMGDRAAGLPSLVVEVRRTWIADQIHHRAGCFNPIGGQDRHPDDKYTDPRPRVGAEYSCLHRTGAEQARLSGRRKRGNESHPVRSPIEDRAEPHSITDRLNRHCRLSVALRRDYTN